MAINLGQQFRAAKAKIAAGDFTKLFQRVRLGDLVQLTSEMKGFHLNNQTMEHIVLPHTHTNTRTHTDSGLLSLCENNGKSDLVRQQVSVGCLKIDALYYTEGKGLF